MEKISLALRLSALMPRFTHRYLNIVLALAGSDHHFHHETRQNEERPEKLNCLFWPLFRLIGKLKLYLPG